MKHDTPIRREIIRRNLFTQSQLLKIIHKSHAWLETHAKLFPKIRTVTGCSRRFYSEADIHAIQKYIADAPIRRKFLPYVSMRDKRLENGLYNSGEACAKLGVQKDWFKRHRQVRPTYMLDNKLFFGPDDLDKAGKIISERINPNIRRRKQLEEMGYLSIVQAAKKFQVKLVTWTNRMNLQRIIPKPTHQFGSQRYYTEAEAREYSQIVAPNTRPKGTVGIGMVAARLNVSPQQASYFCDKLPTIGVRTPKRRYYTPADVDKIVKAYQSQSFKKSR